MMILSIFYNFLKIIFFRDKNVHTASNGIGSRHCIMYNCTLYNMRKLRIQYISWRRRRGENISVDLSLFVLLYNANFMNKLKFYDLKKNSKQITIHRLYTLFSIYKITPLSAWRKGWSSQQEEESALLVYLYYQFMKDILYSLSLG